MRASLTQPIEDYIKTIYQITRNNERATTNQIAEALDIKPASVTGMIKKLASTNPPLVEYQRHRGVVLTEPGMQVALEILRHHRLLEMFLHQILGYDWDEVHDEAERLEHVISEEFEERMAQALGNPSHDPHGDPIPSRDLEMPETSTALLLQLPPQQSAHISRVGSADPDLLRYLSNLGLVPGARVTVLDYSAFDQNLTLQVAGRAEPVVLGPTITRQIYID
jgi:DtxR family Mn-dependent transcriptional regulator